MRTTVGVAARRTTAWYCVVVSLASLIVGVPVLGCFLLRAPVGRRCVAYYDSLLYYSAQAVVVVYSSTAAYSSTHTSLLHQGGRAARAARGRSSGILLYSTTRTVASY